MALADKAKATAGPGFKKPDVTSFVPPGSRDTFARVVAAGIKLMVSPQMRQHVDAALSSKTPVPRTIADNTTGLLLTLDQKVGQGGIPAPVLFPAAVELAAEVAEAMVAGGITVSQEDFNDALLIVYAQVGKKLGASDDQLMQHAEQAAGVEPSGDPAADQQAAAAAAPPQGAPAGGPPGLPPGVPPPGSVPPQPPQGVA